VIEIDSGAFENVGPLRQEELQVLAREIASASDFTLPDGAVRIRAALSEQASTLELIGSDGEVMLAAFVPKDALREHIHEYVDIVRQIEQTEHGGGSSRIEALDMAKKLAHDAAARTLRRLIRPMELDHATCRRLFTVLLALRVDTTKLTGIRAHRPIR